MQALLDRFRYGTILPMTLVASALLGALALAGFVVIPAMEESVDMRITPRLATIVPGDRFTVTIEVESSLPVNVFSGELAFDPQVLEVASIDYNTSIADLWAEKPWYENGAGTLNFIGGTTHPGGFSGTGELIRIHFIARTEGAGTLSIKDAHILKHDGLGTEVTLQEPLDALFTVSAPPLHNLITRSSTGSLYAVSKEPPSLDLNGDGKQTIADISIFMLRMWSSDSRYDFNQDGAVNTGDLSVLLNAQ